LICDPEEHAEGESAQKGAADHPEDGEGGLKHPAQTLGHESHSDAQTAEEQRQQFGNQGRPLISQFLAVTQLGNYRLKRILDLTLLEV